METQIIKHEGLIKKITPDTIFVSVIAQSACEACHAKGFCSAGNADEKIIEVKNLTTNELKIGQHVMVTMDQKMGTKAVLWSYFFPFLIVILTLLIMTRITHHEGLSGLTALLVLVPYYFGLFFFGKKLKSDFEFKIEST
jgi:positive regulator of sigma E activity